MISSALARTVETEEFETEEVLQGLPASGGIAKGICRIITDPKDLVNLEEGTILVFPTAAPAIAPVISRLAAVVTAEGGKLGGAAYYAREQRIPCVTSVKGALDAIYDGQIIKVDGFDGTVTLF